MIRWAAAALPLLTAAASAAPEPQRLQYAQAVIRQQVVVVRVRPTAPAAPVAWKEGKGLKCVPARAILGAAMPSRNSVDLILRDRSRIRARLGNCPALDYYYGFYITPNPDGLICADRDIIKSRMGGQCEIDRFRSLQAVAKR
jgi:hypothetical protein